ncbi:MAG TPA: caspase family protein [Candidatus Brocadiia bacterium]|nr:caspase family protein [Candidatus Brocadiia bacterium]
MRNIKIIMTAALALCATFTGCASIIKGGNQQVTINSEPSGAKVTIYDARTNSIIMTQQTPCTVQLKRGAGYFKRGMYKVVMEKPGYQPSEYQLGGSINGWYAAGNLLDPTLLGYLVVDPITGGMWSMDRDNLSGSLSQGGAVAAAEAPAPAATPSAAPAPKPAASAPAATAPAPAPASAAPPSIRNIHVLVIGIADYQGAIPKLRYTTADAKSFYDFFKKDPNSPARAANVHFLGDEPNEDGLVADKRGILLAMNRYLVKAAVNKEDMAIMYFAGHGDLGSHPSKGTEYYLFPKDAEISDLFVTAIELSEFQRMWSAIPASTKLLVADACNSGGFSGMRGIGGVGIEAAAQTPGGEAKAVFSACKNDQKSMESEDLGHGLFTYAMMEGLKGKADMVCGNNDGRVTLAELKRWVDQQVPLEARKRGGNQTPVTSMVEAWGEVYLTK